MIKSEKLWAAYHHIAKLAELHEDERGNSWAQGTYGLPTKFRSLTDSNYDYLFRGLNQSFDDAIKSIKDIYLAPDDVCGTGMCIAGWYVYLDRLPMNRVGNVLVDGTPEHVSDYVQEDSGLDYIQRCRLFDASNTLDTIRVLLIEYTGEDRS